VLLNSLNSTTGFNMMSPPRFTAMPPLGTTLFRTKRKNDNQEASSAPKARGAGGLPGLDRSSVPSSEHKQLPIAPSSPSQI
jgi:hypothetical protein